MSIRDLAMRVHMTQHRISSEGISRLSGDGVGTNGKLVVSTTADAPHLGGPRADHVLQLPSGEHAVDAMDAPIVAVGHAVVVAHVEEREALTVIQGKGGGRVVEPSQIGSAHE